jgi:hypothetical protein
MDAKKFILKRADRRNAETAEIIFFLRCVSGHSSHHPLQSIATYYAMYTRNYCINLNTQSKCKEYALHDMQVFYDNWAQIGTFQTALTYIQVGHRDRRRPRIWKNTL